MKLSWNSKSVGIVVIAASLCTTTAYLIYTLFKKDEEDEVSFEKKSHFKIVEIDISVPNKLVGALIGRNGNNIREIEDLTKTIIKFDNSKDSEYRLCIIRGSKESCHNARVAINKFIKNQPHLDSENIMVPEAFVPKIIGRCGEEITEIIIRSGAKIVVSNNCQGVTRKITITGTIDQIDIARENIQQIVERCRAAQKNLDEALAKREPRLKSPSPNLIVVHYPLLNDSNSSTLPEDSLVESISPLLGKSDTQYVYVSAVEDPSQFWIQIVGTKAAELDKLVDKMTEYYNNEETRKSHALNSVQIGDRVAAIFENDKKWYRAEVVGVPSDVEPDYAELFYVDYGDYSSVSLSEICTLPTDFLELNFQAIECCLSKIEPIGGKWSMEAIDLFEELAQVAKWKKLVAILDNYSEQPKSDGSPVPGISLYDNGGSQNIAEVLVKNGFAEFKEPIIHNGIAHLQSDIECIKVNE